MNQENKICRLETINPPVGLSLAICEAIHIKARQSAKWHFIALLTLSVSSLASSIYFLLSLWRSFLSSGFYDYISLAVSDAGTLGLFWKQLLVSLAESTPAMTLAIFLAGAEIFVWSGAKTFRTAMVLKTI
jgi:hypothetical protein